MKRKYNFLANEEIDENNIIENSEVYCDNNHIYFYSDVTIRSCFILNIKINELIKKLKKISIDYDHTSPNIYLHINSYGGDLFASFSVIDTIINSDIPIVSIIEGTAASAATLISIVCQKRLMTSNSFMLIHQLSSGSCGKYEELKDEYINDTKLMNLLYKLYLKYTKMNLKKIKKILKRDIWLNYEESLKYGLIDEIYSKKIKKSN